MKTLTELIPSRKVRQNMLVNLRLQLNCYYGTRMPWNELSDEEKMSVLVEYAKTARDIYVRDRNIISVCKALRLACIKVTEKLNIYVDLRSIDCVMGLSMAKYLFIDCPELCPKPETKAYLNWWPTHYAPTKERSSQTSFNMARYAKPRILYLNWMVDVLTICKEEHLYHYKF